MGMQKMPIVDFSSIDDATSEAANGLHLLQPDVHILREVQSGTPTRLQPLQVGPWSLAGAPGERCFWRVCAHCLEATVQSS